MNANQNLGLGLVLMFAWGVGGFHVVRWLGALGQRLAADGWLAWWGW